MPRRIIVGTDDGELLQFKTIGLTWNPVEGCAPPLDPEAQLRQEIAACLRFWGGSHLNTILGKLGLAAVLDQAGKGGEAIDIWLDVAKICGLLHGEALAAVREELERLIPHLESAEEGELVKELKSKLEEAKNNITDDDVPF